MPKLHTNHAAKKRFRITKNGKVLAKGAGKQHINTHMSSKKKQHVVDIKEIKMSYKIEKHDYLVHVKRAEKFLSQDGDKVKATVQLRGREMEHKNLAINLLNRFVQDTSQWGAPEKSVKMEGKIAIVILVPLPHSHRK